MEGPEVPCAVIAPSQPHTRKSDASPDKCPFCLEPLSGKTSLVLDCGHVYHGRCCVQFLLRKRECPCCRAPVTSGENIVDGTDVPDAARGKQFSPRPSPPPQLRSTQKPISPTHAAINERLRAEGAVLQPDTPTNQQQQQQQTGPEGQIQRASVPRKNVAGPYVYHLMSAHGSPIVAAHLVAVPASPATTIPPPPQESGSSSIAFLRFLAIIGIAVSGALLIMFLI